MSKLLMTLLVCAVSISGFAQPGKATVYPVTISFGSIGTGVPGEAPLLKFFADFKKENNLSNIEAYKIAPMGKEGEYKLLFTLKGMKKKQKCCFIEKLREVGNSMTERGSATVETDQSVSTENLGRATIVRNDF